MNFGYTPDQQVTPWGTASERKSISEGGGSTSSHSSSSTSSTAGWNKWQNKLARPWTHLGKNAIPGIDQAYQYGMPNLQNVARNVMGWSNAPPVQWQSGWDALAGSFQPTATEDFYQHSIREPAIREWQQVSLPGLREAYAGNYYHGDRMRREAEMARDLALNLANKRADLEYQSQEAAKQRALQGAPIALQYADFIPKSQATYLQGYLGATNPLLQAYTDYLTKILKQKSSSRSSSSSSGSQHQRSVSHSVTGWNP